LSRNHCANISICLIMQRQSSYLQKLALR
jgi:hypothetical protein